MTSLNSTKMERLRERATNDWNAPVQIFSNSANENMIEKPEHSDSEAELQMCDTNNFSDILCDSNRSLYDDTDYHKEIVRDKSEFNLQENTGELESYESDDNKPSTQDYFGDSESDKENKESRIRLRSDLVPANATSNFKVLSEGESDTYIERSITIVPDYFSQKDTQGITSSILEEDLFVSESELSDSEILQRNTEGNSGVTHCSIATSANMPSILEKDLYLSVTEVSNNSQSMTHPSNNFSSNNANSVSAARDAPDITENLSNNVKETKALSAATDIPNITEDTLLLLLQTNYFATSVPSILEQYSSFQSVSEVADILQSVTHPTNNYSNSNNANETHRSCKGDAVLATRDMLDITEGVFNEQAPAATNNFAQNLSPSNNRCNNEEIRYDIATGSQSQVTSDNDDVTLDVDHIDLSDYESYVNLPEMLSPMCQDEYISPNTQNQHVTTCTPRTTAPCLSADTCTPPNTHELESERLLPRKRRHTIKDENSETHIRRYKKSRKPPRCLRKKRRNIRNYARRIDREVVINIIQDVVSARTIDFDAKLELIGFCVKAATRDRAKDTPTDTD